MTNIEETIKINNAVEFNEVLISEYLENVSNEIIAIVIIKTKANKDSLLLFIVLAISRKLYDPVMFVRLYGSVGIFRP